MDYALKIEKHLGRKVDFWSEVVLQNDGEGTFIKEWNAPEPQPTISDLDKIDVTSEIELVGIHENRRKEYPAIADQLDEIYHNGIDSWKAVIKVTKDKYPKG